MKIENIFKINNLEESLAEAQSRARVRKLTLVNTYAKLNELQSSLDKILYKKDQRGIEATITVYTNVASSYNGVPEATFVRLARNTKGWKLQDVYRSKGIPADIEIHNLDKYKDQIAYKVTRDMQRIICFDIED